MVSMSSRTEASIALRGRSSCSFIPPPKTYFLVIQIFSDAADLIPDLLDVIADELLPFMQGFKRSLNALQLGGKYILCQFAQFPH